MTLRARPADDKASKRKRRGRQLQTAVPQQRAPQEGEPQVRLPLFILNYSNLKANLSDGTPESIVERVMGIEPTQPAWKAGILAVELHPRLNEIYDTINFRNSQEFLHFLFKKFLTKKVG